MARWKGEVDVRRIVTFLAFLTLVLSGCGQSYVLRTKAEMCDPRGNFTGGTQRVTLNTNVSGPRDVLIRIPKNYRPDVRTPVLLLFHGLSSNARAILHATEMYSKAYETGYIVVAPMGAEQPADPQRRAGWGLEGEAFMRDLDLVRHAIDHVESIACVDHGRLYAAGFSNGSAFAMKLACRDDLGITAVAGVAAPYWGEECTRPVPTFYVHGVQDSIIKYYGGDSIIGELPSVPATLGRRAELNGCGIGPETFPVGENVRRRAWVECEADVESYIVDDGGHRWPGAKTRGHRLGVAKGRTNPEINASDLILKFFDAHRGQS